MNLHDQIKAMKPLFPLDPQTHAGYNIASSEAATLAKVVAIPASWEIKAYLDGVIGVVEANSFESMRLWETKGDLSWISSSCGLGQTIGHIDGRPVFLSLTTAVIDDHKIVFLDVTSEVVDWNLILTWLRDTLPATAFRENGYINKTDAMNFRNVFPCNCVRKDGR